MITKEQYIKVRDEQEFPISLIWEYWNDLKPFNYYTLTLEKFTIEFTKFSEWFGFSLLTPNGVKIVTYKGLIDKIYKHFNNKFSL